MLIWASLFLEIFLKILMTDWLTSKNNTTVERYFFWFCFVFWDMSIWRCQSVRLCSVQRAPNTSPLLSMKEVLLPLSACQWSFGLLCFGAGNKSTLGSILSWLAHQPKWQKKTIFSQGFGQSRLVILLFPLFALNISAIMRLMWLASVPTMPMPYPCYVQSCDKKRHNFSVLLSDNVLYAFFGFVFCFF